ncbi:MAG: RDD family protein [Candidatus Aenigmarchaeota archaeon]|nr:RDD family protein [Candidatus Aenigmarchaeota archaeon]
MVKNNADVINRIVAVVIDSVILAVVMFVLSLPLGAQAMMMSAFDVTNPLAATQMAASSMLLSILSLLIGLGYFVYFEGTTGQTIGKKIVNIKVVREDGKPMTYMDALLRTILRVVDGIALYLIGLIVVLSSEKNQRIGDMAAKTIVVKA